jgi:hypothetical protein
MNEINRVWWNTNKITFLKAVKYGVVELGDMGSWAKPFDGVQFRHLWPAAYSYSVTDIFSQNARVLPPWDADLSFW